MSAAPQENFEVDLSTPRAVVVDGVRAVAWTGADGETCVARDVCPHRRAPLSAGTVVDGVLTCPYHGWSYDGAGRCVNVPAIGREGRIPPRARLDMLPVPDELTAAPPVADADAPEGSLAEKPDWLDGDTAGLEHFWHPVARLSEAPTEPAVVVDVELLGRTWQIAADAAGGWHAHSGDQSAWGVVAHIDHVWLAPREPIAPLPVAVEWGTEGWHHRRLSRTEGRFGVGLLIDNQFDAGHFPFVHTTTFGTPAAAATPESDVVRAGTTVTSVMRIPIAAGNDPRALVGDRPLQQHRTMRYEYHAPLWLRLRLDYEDMGGSTVIFFAFTPVAAGRARMDIDVLFQHPDGFTDEKLDARVAFEERVIAEDLRLQRLFEDLRLPLDPSVEVSTKADRLSLQCRQVLREMLAVARRVDEPESAKTVSAKTESAKTESAKTESAKTESE